MAMRKRNSSSLKYKDYLNSSDSSKMTFDEWLIKKEDEWEDTDFCDQCESYKGSEYICPKCGL